MASANQPAATAKIIPFRSRSLPRAAVAKPPMQPCVDIHGWYHEAAVQAEVTPRGLRRP